MSICNGQGSHYFMIQAKKSPWEGWLCFLVDKKWKARHLVFLNSSSMSPEYFFAMCHVWKLGYCIYSNPLKSNPLSFKELFLFLQKLIKMVLSEWDAIIHTAEGIVYRSYFFQMHFQCFGNFVLLLDMFCLFLL